MRKLSNSSLLRRQLPLTYPSVHVLCSRIMAIHILRASCPPWKPSGGQFSLLPSLNTTSLTLSIREPHQLSPFRSNNCLAPLISPPQITSTDTQQMQTGCWLRLRNPLVSSSQPLFSSLISLFQLQSIATTARRLDASPSVCSSPSVFDWRLNHGCGYKLSVLGPRC